MIPQEIRLNVKEEEQNEEHDKLETKYQILF